MDNPRTRTTPPRPYDLEARHPALAEFRRTATRLHPRPGTPGPGDSSVGGPLLWPADEPWPLCPDVAGHEDRPWSMVADIRRERRLLASRDQLRARGADATADDQALAALRSRRKRTAGRADGTQQPMIGVAQLYARDVPDLAFPSTKDLLQILWCPYDHSDEDYLPLVRVVWRTAASVREATADPSPGVAVGDESYVPERCAVHPEPIAEYPPTWTEGVPLPPELKDYDDHWSLADGWKAGGWGGYCGYTDPEIPPCHCGAGTVPLLTVGNGEWSPEDLEWRPLEDAAFTPTPEHPVDWNPVRTHIGRAYLLQIFRCAKGFDCPPTVRMT